MGHGPQPGFVDQLSGNPADAIGFVFNPHHGFFQMINEGDLAAGHLAQLFSFHTYTAIFHGHVAGFVHITTLIFPGDQALEISQFLFSGIQFFLNNLSEFGEVSIGITHGGSGFGGSFLITGCTLGFIETRDFGSTAPFFTGGGGGGGGTSALTTGAGAGLAAGLATGLATGTGFFATGLAAGAGFFATGFGAGLAAAFFGAGLGADFFTVFFAAGFLGATFLGAGLAAPPAGRAGFLGAGFFLVAIVFTLFLKQSHLAKHRLSRSRSNSGHFRPVFQAKIPADQPEFRRKYSL